MNARIAAARKRLNDMLMAPRKPKPEIVPVPENFPVNVIPPREEPPVVTAKLHDGTAAGGVVFTRYNEEVFR